MMNYLMGLVKQPVYIINRLRNPQIPEDSLREIEQTKQRQNEIEHRVRFIELYLSLLRMDGIHGTDN